MNRILEPSCCFGFNEAEFSSTLARVRRLEARSRCALSGWWLKCYAIRVLRPVVRRIVLAREGGPMFSRTLRDIVRSYGGVEVGRYSYGPCLVPGQLPRGTRVGNYTSLAEELLVFRRNHPTERLSMHPFFYNRACGVLPTDAIGLDEDNPLQIGHDVWIGARVTILPGCKSVGTGAVLGAGAVVSTNVEPFSVVAGNPARVIRQRFNAEMRARLLQSEWWRQSLPELLATWATLLRPLDMEGLELVERLRHEALETP